MLLEQALSRNLAKRKRKIGLITWNIKKLFIKYKYE